MSFEPRSLRGASRRVRVDANAIQRGRLASVGMTELRSGPAAALRVKRRTAPLQETITGAVGWRDGAV